MATLIPYAWSNLTLDEFLKEILLAYPSVEDALKLLVDQSTPEYATWHMKSVDEHVSTIWVVQRGITYQLNRVSNIRGTVGQSTYRYIIWDIDNSEKEVATVGYRKFTDKFSDWITIKV